MIIKPSNGEATKKQENSQQKNKLLVADAGLVSGELSRVCLCWLVAQQYQYVVRLLLLLLLPRLLSLLLLLVVVVPLSLLLLLLLSMPLSSPLYYR